MKDDLKTPTMGCMVEQPGCSVCGEVRCEHLKHAPREQHLSSGFYEVSESPTFLYATTVPAPKCESCGVSLAVHEGKDWVCVEESCAAVGVVVPAHWFQVFPVRGVL